MASKLKFIVIFILIFSLLLVNFSYCASGSINDPFYVNYSTIYGSGFYVTELAIKNIETNTSNLDNHIVNWSGALSQDMNFTPNSPVNNTDDYIIHEQDFIQDIFIYCCNADVNLATYARNHFTFDIYGIILGDGRISIRIYDCGTNGNNYTTMDDTSYNKSYSYNITQSAHGRVYQVNYDTTTINSVGGVVVNISDGSFTFNPNSTLNNVKIPICVLCYKSANLYNYLQNLRGLDEATNQTTKAIKESTDRILSNDEQEITGVGVTDGATDNSVNLSNVFNTFSNAFTSRVSGFKPFTFTLPNGTGYNFNISGNMLTNLLTAYDDGTLFRFYQAIYWIILGGYVLFDIKNIINNLKGGDIDKLTSNSSPIDSVVKASVR